MKKVLLRRSDFKQGSQFDEIAKVMEVETAFSNKIVLFVKDAVALSSTETKPEQLKKLFVKMDIMNLSDEYEVQWEGEKSLFDNKENKTFSSLKEAYAYIKSQMGEITTDDQTFINTGMIDDGDEIKLFTNKKLVCTIVRVDTEEEITEEVCEVVKEP